VPQQVIKAALPRLIRVTADIDALDEYHLFCVGVLHIHIDIQDEIADLLDRTPCSQVGRAKVLKLSLFDSWPALRAFWVSLVPSR
jgi:hypothetical protein